jgi:hypothetical protein
LNTNRTRKTLASSAAREKSLLVSISFSSMVRMQKILQTMNSTQIKRERDLKRQSERGVTNKVRKLSILRNSLTKTAKEKCPQASLSSISSCLGKPTLLNKPKLKNPSQR